VPDVTFLKGRLRTASSRLVAGLLLVTSAGCGQAATQQPGPSAQISASPQLPPRQTIYVPAEFATALAWAPDGRLFFAERTGAIKTFDGKTVTAFASMRPSTSGERGLLGLAVSPSFSRDHFVYAFYSRSDDETRQRVVRWTDKGGVGTSLTAIVENLPGGTDCCHKGGRLAFGPDGKLYVSLGEAHVASDAQNPARLGGKILRYNADGTVPTDNPFGAGNPVWAIGLRNPFGLAFAPDGQLMVTDNGPSGDAGTPGSGWDEVDHVVRGGNYQWPTCYGDGQHLQGSSCNGTAPTYQTGRGTIVPTGATFVSQKGPTGYQGDFVFCSYAESRLKVLSPDGTRLLLNGPRCQLDVKEGLDHALYMSDASTIYRFGP
jgi:glucose/arabinose dehydrogenase